jgi:hypothetical protein
VESGTTSLVAFFKENELYVANAGDSRAVFCKNKISMCITEDHKPDLEREYKRICSIPAGLVQKSRVQGKLAVARAIGDFKWNPYVSEIPDVYGPFNWKDPQYEFLILACDGLWDVMDEKKACDFVRKCKDPREAAIKLRDWAYNERSKDNLSVIVIWFPGFIPDYEPPPVVQKLLQTRNNNAQSNDGKSETSDNSEIVNLKVVVKEMMIVVVIMMMKVKKIVKAKIVMIIILKDNNYKKNHQKNSKTYHR